MPAELIRVNLSRVRQSRRRRTTASPLLAWSCPGVNRPLWPARAAGLVALLALALGAALPAAVAQSGDVTQVPLWDGETVDPTSGALLNRFGGNPVQGIHATVSSTTSVVRSGAGAFRVDTNQPIPPGGFDFIGIALTGFGPTSSYVDTRDLTPFAALDLWLRNETGSAFTLALEVKDYRDSNLHRARRSYLVSSVAVWTLVHAPLDLGSGWVVDGDPDLSRAKVVALVIQADQGQTVGGSVYLDDVTLVEPGGPVDPMTAPIEELEERIAHRQLAGLWGARDRTTGLVPSISSYADVCATNALAALVKLMPGAISRGWVARSDADQWLTTVVATLGTLMDSAMYLPPRYVDRVTLEPAWTDEESSVDAAFLYLALYQYRSDPGVDPSLRAAVDQLLDRFDFSVFATPGGWSMAYHESTGQFAGPYDGYSGEPWLISLAAHLSSTHHVGVETLYHSATLRVRDFLVDPARAHLVHASDEFRAPFLQWLLPLFVDVSDRGPDSYPDATLACNPFDNAVLYQLEVDARRALLGRALLLQPDAGDDGTGGFYRQFSCYNDFGHPDLFMPWSAALIFPADPEAAAAALRNHLAHGLHGPLGLSDSVDWLTGAPTRAASPAATTSGTSPWQPWRSASTCTRTTTPSPSSPRSRPCSTGCSPSSATRSRPGTPAHGRAWCRDHVSPPKARTHASRARAPLDNHTYPRP